MSCLALIRFSAKFTVRDFLHLRDKEDMPLTNNENQLVLFRSTLCLPIQIIPTPLTFMERQAIAHAARTSKASGTHRPRSSPHGSQMSNQKMSTTALPMSSPKNIAAPHPIPGQKSSQMSALQKPLPPASERVPFVNSIISLPLPEGDNEDNTETKEKNTIIMHHRDNIMDITIQSLSSQHILTTPSSPLGLSIHGSTPGNSPVPVLLVSASHNQSSGIVEPKGQFLRLALRSSK